MARRSIDTLPLRDVFMVVLFVFATIQEQQLDSSSDELDAAQATLAAAAEQLEQQSQRIREHDAAMTKLEARREQQTREAQTLRKLVREYERECGPRWPDVVCPAAAAARTDARELAAIQTLQARLLDNIAVFEIELEGEPNLETGELRNRCCYRSDPPDGAWKACGVTPSDRAGQQAWLDAGADGLVDALGRTRGGNAIVLLGQGELAHHEASGRLAKLLDERFANYRVYDDGPSAGLLECPLLQP